MAKYIPAALLFISSISYGYEVLHPSQSYEDVVVSVNSISSMSGNGAFSLGLSSNAGLACSEFKVDSRSQVRSLDMAFAEMFNYFMDSKQKVLRVRYTKSAVYIYEEIGPDGEYSGSTYEVGGDCYLEDYKFAVY